MSETRRRRGLVAWALAVGLLVPVFAPARAEAPGAETPQALVERIQRAAKNEDLGEVMDCLAPKARVEMAAGMYMVATMVVAFSQMGVEMGAGMAESLSEDASAEQKAEMAAQKEKARAEAARLRESYNALVAKYGLPVIPEEGEAEAPQGEAEEMFGDIDQAAFLRDVMAFLEAMPGDEVPTAETRSPIGTGEGVLTDLVIDGDAATGKVDGEEAKFVRIDGRWYLDAEGLLQKGPGAATEP